MAGRHAAARAGGTARARRAPRASAAGLERLWAPWRMPYLRAAASPAGCLFCAVRDARDDRRHLVLARRPHALLMLNRFPYAAGHLMVAVARHAGAFAELSAEEREDLIALTAVAERALAEADRPDGINVGANLGRVAGAGFPGHLHLHVVPRWNGDTNFMTVVAGARVLPEALTDTWRRLRRAVRALDGARARGGRAER